MRLPLLTPVAVAIALTVAVTPSDAGPFSWLSKVGRTAGNAAPKAAVVARIGRGQVLALASELGAGAVYVEARSGKLFLEAIDSGVGGVEGGFDDLTRLTQRVRAIVPGANGQYLMSAESATELGRHLDTLADSGAVYIAEPGMGAALRLTRRIVGSQPRYFKQVRPNVLVPLESPISAEAAEALSAPLQKSRISVVSMFSPSDVDARRKLASAAGDRLEETDRVLEALRAGSLEPWRNRTIIAVGHVENGAFVARNARGEIVYSVRIAELERLAAAADAQLLSAGCHSACSGARTGFLDSVSDTDMADAVRNAFEATTNADLLEAFGRTRPLVVSDRALEQFAASRTLHLNEMAAGSRTARAGAVSVRLMSVMARRSALWDVLPVLGIWYVIGVFALMGMGRTSQEALLEVFPKLPSPQLPETRLPSLAAWSGRHVLYVTVGPVVAAITTISFLFGGWSYRQRIMVWLWGFFRYPLRQTGHLLYVLISGAAIGAGYLLGVALLIEGGDLVAGGVTHVAGTWPAVAVVLVYSVVAIWGLVKAHRRFHRWMTSSSEEGA
jgi:hypothetical protein